jgi:threonine/homoserine/homoserine lactone efflux protein
LLVAQIVASWPYSAIRDHDNLAREYYPNWMNIESWIALVLALTILGISPGPAWAAVVTTSIGRGFLPAAAMVMGIALGDVFFLLLAVLGLALLAKALGTLFLLVKFAGAAYLIWLGIKLWRHPPAVVGSVAAPSRALGPFFGGFALTLGNPKVIAFYLGFLPAVIDLRSLTAWDIGLVAVTTFAIIATILSGYAAVAAGSRRFLLRERVRRGMSRVLGSTLIGTGVIFVTR